MAGPATITETVGTSIGSIEQEVSRNTIQAAQKNISIPAPVRQLKPQDQAELFTYALNGEKDQFQVKITKLIPKIDVDDAYRVTVKTVMELKITLANKGHAEALLAGKKDEATLYGTMSAASAIRLSTELNDTQATAWALSDMAKQNEDIMRSRGMSDDQIAQAKLDLARAAVGYGFSTSDVLNVFGEMKGVQIPGEDKSFEFMIAQISMRHSVDIMNNLRKLSEELEGEGSAKERKKKEAQYKEMLTEYAHNNGGGLASIVDKWSKSLNEDLPPTEYGRTMLLTQSDLIAAVEAHSMQVLALHTGRLGDVAPRRVS